MVKLGDAPSTRPDQDIQRTEWNNRLNLNILALRITLERCLIFDVSMVFSR